MNTTKRYVLVFALTLLAGAAIVAVAWAAPGIKPLAPGGAPTVVAYQGEVWVSGSPYDGDGFFKFAFVNAAGDTSYWSNDGTSTGGGEPTATVVLTVTEGMFSVLLGDTTVGGISETLSADVFSQSESYLRVWFSESASGPFNKLTPDTRITSVPYALQAQEALNADTLDGMHASELGANYQNVVVVAKSGGDFTSVQAAIDSITGTVDNPYLVWIAPGTYSETVTMKPFIHLEGAGQEATLISSTASSSWPPTNATLILASDTSLRNLTLGNDGVGEYKSALVATAGMTRTLVADVTVRAQGSGQYNRAIDLSGSGTGVRLQQVTALAENGDHENFGLYISDGAAAILIGGSFTGRGVEGSAFGIKNFLGGTLDAEGVTALGENGNSNMGFYNSGVAVLRGGSFTGRGGSSAKGITTGGYLASLEADSVTALGENGSLNNLGLSIGISEVRLRGGSFTGRGGEYAYGVVCHGLGATLEAESVTALGEEGTNRSHGMENQSSCLAKLRGGSFTARGGIDTYGIQNYAKMEAESVTALGENGSSSNYGLKNHNEAALRGGSFTGRGGTDTKGIYNHIDTDLEADNVTALAENGSGTNYGLENNQALATLRGSSCIGRGGSITRGIYNTGSGAELETINATALGENGDSSNYGLYNYSGATARLRSGAFIGRGGSNNGIYNTGSGTTLEAENVLVLGEDGTIANYGLYNSISATSQVTQSVLEGADWSVALTSGSVDVSNSRLSGEVYGSVTCTAVSEGSSFFTNSCPP